MLSAVAVAFLQLGSENPPPFYTAQDRWTCDFRGFGDGEMVRSHIGVFRTHVEDDLGLNHTIIQNDDGVLIFAQSSYGDETVDGSVIKDVLVTVIDKRQRTFKRANVRMDGPPEEREGNCSPY